MLHVQIPPRLSRTKLRIVLLFCAIYSAVSEVQQHTIRTKLRIVLLRCAIYSATSDITTSAAHIQSSGDRHAAVGASFDRNHVAHESISTFLSSVGEYSRLLLSGRSGTLTVLLLLYGYDKKTFVIFVHGTHVRRVRKIKYDTTNHAQFHTFTQQCINKTSLYIDRNKRKDHSVMVWSNSEPRNRRIHRIGHGPGRILL